MNEIFNEEVVLKLIALLEGATAWGAFAVIIYFMIPVLVAFVQFGFGVWAVKYISEGVRDLFIGISGDKGIVRRIIKINFGKHVITAEEENLYNVLMLAHKKANQSGKTYTSEYWHDRHIEWLRQAVEEKADREKEKNQ